MRESLNEIQNYSIRGCEKSFKDVDWKSLEKAHFKYEFKKKNVKK